MHTDREFMANKPDIVIKNKTENMCTDWCNNAIQAEECQVKGSKREINARVYVCRHSECGIWNACLYLMEQSPSWEANWLSASQEILRILWNPKVHYRIHKCPPTVPIQSQLDPVHNPTSDVLKIHINIMNPSMPDSSKWSLTLRFPHQNLVYASPLPHTRYIPRPSHSLRFCPPKNIGCEVNEYLYQ